MGVAGETLEQMAQLKALQVYRMKIGAKIDQVREERQYKNVQPQNNSNSYQCHDTNNTGFSMKNLPTEKFEGIMENFPTWKKRFT